MRSLHEITVMLGASGTSGHGTWIFVGAMVAGLVAVVVWVATRLRASGYLERARPTIEVYPDLYDEDVPSAA